MGKTEKWKKQKKLKKNDEDALGKVGEALREFAATPGICMFGVLNAPSTGGSSGKNNGAVFVKGKGAELVATLAMAFDANEKIYNLVRDALTLVDEYKKNKENNTKNQPLN